MSEDGEVPRQLVMAAARALAGPLVPWDTLPWQTQDRLLNDAFRCLYEILPRARAAMLEEIGLERRYYLAGHPAWPDPLTIWPPTQQEAERVFETNPHPDAKLLAVWVQPRAEVLRDRCTEVDP